MDYELILFDRLNVIRDVNRQYDLVNNAYLSFSGGKDSTVLHYLIDMAIPNNRIPRVFINTGIEYNDIVNFVKELSLQDDRFVIITPLVPIKPMLDKYGYPFKSKEHSFKLSQYKKGLRSRNVLKYASGENSFCCPTKLLYQFTDDFKLNISNQCCNQMKKKPVHKWAKENGRFITITGMRNDEGGQRANIKGCILTDRNGKLTKFHPLLKVDEVWENKFIDLNNINVCKLYKQPYNFVRTGCKGCPYNLNLQKDLDTMAQFLPLERKQCEIIWKPVYEEYRRLNYRLNKQMSIFDFIN